MEIAHLGEKVVGARHFGRVLGAHKIGGQVVVGVPYQGTRRDTELCRYVPKRLPRHERLVDRLALFVGADCAASGNIAPFTDGDAPEAVQVVGGFRFANGIALDEDAGHVYVAETMASRLHRFSIGVAPEQASDATVVLEVDHPDNLEFDEQGRLWIASPVRSEIVVFDPEEGRAESVFRIATPASEKQIQEIDARLSAGEPWLDLMTPTLWEPGPGLITGMILSPDSGPVYLTGLGAGLVQLSR